MELKNQAQIKYFRLFPDRTMQEIIEKSNFSVVNIQNTIRQDSVRIDSFEIPLLFDMHQLPDFDRSKLFFFIWLKILYLIL